MKRKTKAGGARPGAGRQAIEDKKLPVTFYIQKSIIESYGGQKGLKAHFKDLFKPKIPDQ